MISLYQKEHPETFRAVRRYRKLLDRKLPEAVKKDGCMWAVRPLVCALFLCATAEKAVLAPTQDLERQWVEFRRRQRQFSRPDQVVLFDTPEKAFQRFGVDAPLIYFHSSPGLINIKRKAGLR